MNRFKIFETASEVYWMSTHQGHVSINGKEIEYRYSEDSNGATLWVLENDRWVEVDTSVKEYDLLNRAILEYGVTDLGPAGDEFDFEPEEDF